MRDESEYILYDLQESSILEPITTKKSRFRVTKYDPREMAKTHRPGRHQYLVCREAIESDVMISIPKLKTHRKAGITGALKNLVGINGHKHYLPHHRIGGSWQRGDCYPRVSPLRRIAEYCLDRCNMSVDFLDQYQRWNARAYKLLHLSQRLSRRLGKHWCFEGSWSGNDTCWRMVLDLNRILLYGRSDGTLAKSPQRKCLSIVDAIIVGQGEGPLETEPLPLGCILAGTDPAALDWIGASLIGMRPDHVPLLRNAFEEFRWPISSAEPETLEVESNGGRLSLDSLTERFSLTARLPQGWENCAAADGRHATHSPNGN
jgi:hypothetical protein